MRHNVAHRKLGRVTEHRLALLRNQAIALLRHERIETTVPKAKELRPFVERLITVAVRGVAAGDAGAKMLNARRKVLADLPDKDVVGKLFETNPRTSMADALKAISAWSNGPHREPTMVISSMTAGANSSVCCPAMVVFKTMVPRGFTS